MDSSIYNENELNDLDHIIIHFAHFCVISLQSHANCKRKYRTCRLNPAGTSPCIQPQARPLDLALRLNPVAGAPAKARPRMHFVADIRAQLRDRDSVLIRE